MPGLQANGSSGMSAQQISDMCAAFGRFPSELEDIALRSLAYNAQQRDDHHDTICSHAPTTHGEGEWRL
jgi:hypothetical protein